MPNDELVERLKRSDKRFALQLFARGFLLTRQKPTFVPKRWQSAKFAKDYLGSARLGTVHVAQVISYSKAFEQPLGLLITFNVALLKNGIRRVVNSRR